MSAKDAANAAERRYNEALRTLDTDKATAFRAGVHAASIILDRHIAATKWAGDARVLKRAKAAIEGELLQRDGT